MGSVIYTELLLTVPKDHLKLGQSGEELAKGFLKKNGYRIIACNYKSRIGEIDIVAEEKGVICFVEVKTRQSLEFGLPEEAVFNLKQRKLSLVALEFLKANSLLEANARFDVVSVIVGANTPKIELIKNAFEFNQMPSY